MSEALNCLAAGFLEILNRDERGDGGEEPRAHADGGEESRARADGGVRGEEPRPDVGEEPRARSRRIPHILSVCR